MAVLRLNLAERWLFSLNKWRKSGYFDEHKILKVAEKWLLLSKKWRDFEIFILATLSGASLFFGRSRKISLKNKLKFFEKLALLPEVTLKFAKN